MARKKADEVPMDTPPMALPVEPENGTDGTATATQEQPPANGKKGPVYKVGPIPTDRNTSVEAAVWQNENSAEDGRKFTTYNVTVQGSWRDADGQWKRSSSFRSSHLYTLIYCLQKCSDYILSLRDQAKSPF